MTTQTIETTYRTVDTATGEIKDLHEVTKEALFDPKDYVDRPVMDGQATDKLTISFTGSIAYDANDWQGKKMFENMTLGKELELRVSGTVVGKSGAWKLSSSEEEVVTGNAKMRVTDIYVLTPEDLS